MSLLIESEFRKTSSGTTVEKLTWVQNCK